MPEDVVLALLNRTGEFAQVHIIDVVAYVELGLEKSVRE